MATAEENLKSQFQLLQDQQQKKLLRRKQRKEEQRAKTASVLPSHTNNAFGVSDQLDLKLAAPSQNQSYVSEELVDHLNEQIRELKDENGRVYKLLSERDFELRNLKKKREEEKVALAATGGPVTNETAGTKIVELSKKVREMTAELESEKNKSRQLARKCQDLQQQVAGMNSDNKSIRASTISLRSSIDEKPDDPNEIKVLQDKLKQMESKMIDYRNSNSTLKQELRIAHKALSQEVGDNVNIQSCLSANSNWRGRAQQILQLQLKNDELKQEVQKLKGATEAYDLEAEMLGNKKKSAVDRHKDQLKKLEKEKKDAQGKMAAEKEALEEENFALKHKLDVSKTRNQVLSNEIKNLKKQVPELLKKNEHDNELIEALMKEQTNIRQQLDEARKNQHNIKIEQQHKLNEMNAKEQHEKNVVEQLKTIVADKETKVKVLENEIQQLKLAHLQRAQMNKLFEPSGNQSQANGQTPIPVQNVTVDSRPSTGFETVDLQYQIGTETPPPDSRMSDVPNIPLPENNALPSRGPVVEFAKPPSRALSRSHSRSNRPSSGNRPPSGTRPSSASKTVDNEMLGQLQYQCQEYRTVAQVAEVERDKLTELTKMLQSRLDDSAHKLQENQKELLDQRRRNALLEKQVAKANLTTARSAGGMSARKKSGLTASVSNLPTMPEDEDVRNMSVEELVVSLEIQRDENEALKAALQTTLKSKEEDMRIYSDTIEETKKVFLQALRQYKQTVHGT
ncbi:coiled-coil domain-containing protein 13-like isoform X2 [Ruditapes philippinarum]|nr:coiled-coil domain-containing protein 13-like isoform X2 [Ruditapes philippinarum]